MCAKSCTRLTDECAWQSLNALKTGIEAIDNVRRVGAILAKRTDDQNSDRMSQVTMFGYCCVDVDSLDMARTVSAAILLC